MTDPNDPAHPIVPGAVSGDVDWGAMFAPSETPTPGPAGARSGGPTPRFTDGAGVPPVLERNLAALERGSARAAEAIRNAFPSTLVSFETAPDSGLTATLEDPAAGRRVALASRRRPLSEAARIAESAEVTEHALVVVLGFGVGHHVEAIARAMGTSGLVLVFEPDVGLLRAVFERVDCSAWLGSSNVALVTDPDDPVAVSAVFEGLEGVVGLGVKVLDHAPSLGRLGEKAQAFRERLRRAIGDVRTTLVTTLAMAETTARNLLMNADVYATAPGVEQLAGAARGRPAIVVSAGPSLARNIELLADPSVRERFVVIAVQTVLKTLLARGIRPHFVTAIDYHEISTRFYEGLTPGDVEGVRLIAEPKANPGILAAFPGEVVVAGNGALHGFLPGAPLPARGELPAAATVAHLAYDVGRHLGCDPIVLVGQDLGFTDGQYYSEGAAIHRVWAGELSAFNTLEMMEWQRIARAKTLLHRRADQRGRAIYLDEQMANYLGQFERQFERERAAGRRVIDATEGGVAKHGTEAMTLAEAIERFGGEPVGEIPTSPAVGGGGAGGRDGAVRQIAASMESGRKESRRIARLCDTTADLLRRTEKAWDDAAERNRLIEKIHACRAEVESLKAGWRLTRFLDQSGTLERMRSDRKIDLAGDNSEDATQRRRAGRDLRNVESLGRAARRAEYLYERSRAAVTGRAPKMVRDPSLDAGADAGGSLDRVHGGEARARVGAVVIADFGRGVFGNGRSLGDGAERGTLWWTLARLSRAGSLDAVVVLSDEPERAGAVVGSLPRGRVPVRVERLGRTPEDSARRASVGRARLWARSCWRAGLGGMTVFDEAFEPGPVDRWLADAPVGERLDAVVPVGGDWAAIDPALVDAVADRFRAAPEHRVCFAPAAPGFGAIAIDRGLVRDFASAMTAGERSPLATLGGALGYVPVAPQFDPLATPACVTLDPAVRDAGVRAIGDDAASARMLIDALGSAGIEADAGTLARCLGGLARPSARITLATRAIPEPGGWLATSRAAGWARARLGLDASDDGVLSAEGVSRALGTLVGDGSGPGTVASVTIDGVGDPFALPGIAEIIQAAREGGAAGVHVRTPLLDDNAIELAGWCDVVSVDMLAGDDDTARALGGVGCVEAVVDRIERLCRAPGRRGVLPATWVVPRVTRCDAVLEQIEGLFDGGFGACGWCVIDPAPDEPGERLRALPAPSWAGEANAGVIVHPDGSLHASAFERSAGRPFAAPRAGVQIEGRAGLIPDGAAA